MECLYCGKKIGVLRKLHDSEFCSVVHRQVYARKQDQAALDFLLQSKPVIQSGPVKHTPAEVAQPQPILVAAEFTRYFVAAAIAPCQPICTQPLPLRSSAIAPPSPRPIRPALRLSDFSSPELSVNVSSGCIASRESSCLHFATWEPLLGASWIERPVWLASKPGIRKRTEPAGFVAIRLIWRYAAGTADWESAGAAPFMSAMAFARVESPPCAPVLRLASASPAEIAWKVLNPAPPATDRNIEPQGYFRLPDKPKSGISPRAKGFSAGGYQVLTRGWFPANPGSAGRSPALISKTSPIAPAAAVRAHPPVLRLAVTIRAPMPHSFSAEPRARAACETLLWRRGIYLGAYKPVSMMRPDV